jgi:DNA-directed RNA polymerase specialized sigma24 family protein
MSQTAESAKSRTLAADADLARDAAAGDEESFDILYQRHIQPAWRFAQAVAASREEAEKATTEAFVRVLRIVHRGRSAAAEQFRPYLLAAVYRHGIDAARAAEQQGQEHFGGSALAERSDAPVEHQLNRAFRSLPERWRAALWLADVEGFTASDAAPILGVSSAVAAQLATRGRAGLEARVSQQRQSDMPAIGVVLRAAALTLPVGLGPATKDAWRKALASERRRAVPAAGWFIDRAPRPLLVAAAGLLAIGIIGAAVVGQRGGPGRSTPLGGQVAEAPASAAGVTVPTTEVPSSGTVTFVNAGATSSSAGSQASGAQAALAAAAAGATTPTTLAGASPLPGSGSGSTQGGGTPAPGTPPAQNPPPQPTPAQPVLATSTNLSVAQLNLGLGSGACTGLSVGSLAVGCTTASAPGVTAGSSLLGKKPIHLP